MSALRPRRVSWCPLAVFFAAAAGLALAGSAGAGDLLEKARLESDVKVQQAVASIKGLIDEARRVVRTNPEQARAFARQARTQLDGAANLSAGQRVDLGGRITQVFQDADASVRERDLKGGEGAQAATQQQREEQRRREQEEAAQKNSVVGKAKDIIGTGKKAIDNHTTNRDKAGQNFNKIGEDNAKTAAAMVEERFPKGWAEVTERRKPFQLTKAEKELMKMLNSTLSVDFSKEALKNVLEFLMDKTGQTILPDEAALKEAMIEYDSPVTIKAKKVTVRTVLKKVLADVGLTFIVKDATIHVTTPERAREHMVRRVYPIADLLPLVDPRWGPYANRAQTFQAVQNVMNMIVTSIEPNSWQVNGAGGRGTIVYDEGSRALVIHQSAEWHYQQGGYLGK